MRTLVYTTRSNTDTTCLLSGTAVKGTLGYVSDYLVKQALKTYQIFSTARTVFENNEELLQSDNDIDSGRKLILKVLNSLMAKMEIGGPMAAMYLLGNPDRYTGHEFVSFYWKNYVNRVLEGWYSQEMPSDDDEVGPEPDEEEEVVLNRWGNRVVGRSYVDNYTCRPEQYEDVNLYEWIQCNNIVTKKSLPLDSNKVGGKLYFEFLESHSLHLTHAVTCIPERRDYIVPNFIGPGLPRLGAGDDDYYACTMLCLFKPWRSGRDLKSSNISWHEQWKASEFTAFQSKLMVNFNLRYECYDSRDDFSLRSRSRKDQESGNLEDIVSDEEGVISGDYIDDGMTEDARDIREQDGPETRKRKEQMKIAKGVLEDAGWTNMPRLDQGDLGAADDNGARREETEGFKVPDNVDPDEWQSIVKEEREKRLKARFSKASAEESAEAGVEVANSVRVVHPSFISSDFLVDNVSREVTLDSISKDKTLNSAQDRAYRIVAQHSLLVCPQQLLMNISGSAGTGKTQVIKALTAWFLSQGEAQKLALIAPTGTAASQIGGSTWHYYLGIQTFEGGKVKKSTVKAIQEAR
ncbi:hypothetical protein BKA70DRAFT_1127307, partial [Coprinopsis sp. MPI-PUGE-AT-0042]